MGVLIYIVVILISSLVLLKAVELFSNSSSKIAKNFMISSFTISFFLIAISTSLPELIIGITSAIKGNPILAYSNLSGSNITMVTYILAIPILLKGFISTRGIIHSKDVYYSTFLAFMPQIMALDGTITRLDGAIMLGTYLIYASTVIKRSQGLERMVDSFEKINIKKEIITFAIACALLIGASEGILKATLGISESLGWSLGFVGITLTSIGTCVPELVFSIRSIKKGQADEILGNVIGSLAVNATFILGIVAIISPIVLKGSNFGAATIFFLTFALLLFLKFTKTKEKMDIREAVIQILFYLTFVFVQYKIQ
ncbi:MAG: sodium:calcium antiporter [Patescibacteria group bacterium]|jgi:cation:H+ antiporter